MRTPPAAACRSGLGETVFFLDRLLLVLPHAMGVSSESQYLLSHPEKCPSQLLFLKLRMTVVLDRLVCRFVTTTASVPSPVALPLAHRHRTFKFEGVCVCVYEWCKPGQCVLCKCLSAPCLCTSKGKEAWLRPISMNLLCSILHWS